jgi:hypothetical protein
MNSKTRDDAASAATDCSRSIVPDGHGHRVFVIQKEQSCNRGGTMWCLHPWDPPEVYAFRSHAEAAVRNRREAARDEALRMGISPNEWLATARRYRVVELFAVTSE